MLVTTVGTVPDLKLWPMQCVIRTRDILARDSKEGEDGHICYPLHDPLQRIDECCVRVDGLGLVVGRASTEASTAASCAASTASSYGVYYGGGATKATGVYCQFSEGNSRLCG
jgi:hypothetical protein